MDGEGATRVAHITVCGAKKKEIAEKNCPQDRHISIDEKRPFSAATPNWGRIIAAAGDAGVPVTPSKVDITLQGEKIAEGGLEKTIRRAEAKEVDEQKGHRGHRKPQ